MKIQNIQTTGVRNNTTAKTQAQPAFRGAADGLVKFWDAIERGGWTANFLLQDFGGNNVPRIAFSLNRNKKELGHLNYSAGAEALIRELLSGPSMVVVPLGVMAASTRLAGPATKIPTKNIADFSEVMKGTLTNLGEGAEIGKDALRTAFYTDVLDTVGKHSLDGSKEFTAHALEKIERIESGALHKRGLFKKLFDKDIEGSLDKAVSELQEAFSKFRRQKVGYNEGLLSAQIAEGGKGTKFEDLISQMKDYFDDFAKKGLEAGSEGGKIKLPAGVDTIIDKFKNLRTGQRFVTGIAMTGLMMIVLSFIPKLYSFNKTSPELSQGSSETQKDAGGAK